MLIEYIRIFAYAWKYLLINFERMLNVILSAIIGTAHNKLFQFHWLAAQTREPKYHEPEEILNAFMALFARFSLSAVILRPI